MKKYYTRVCNFYYGNKSIELINQKKTLSLKGNNQISFDQIEIISRNSKKLINVKNITKLPISLKKKITKDLKIITQKSKNFSNLDFKKIPNIMGVLNLTPDSFSDGGKFNNKKLG
jgi:dihydropteroate synthase